MYHIWLPYYTWTNVYPFPGPWTKVQNPAWTIYGNPGQLEGMCIATSESIGIKIMIQSARFPLLIASYSQEEWIKKKSVSNFTLANVVSK